MEDGSNYTPAELRLRVLELQQKKVQEEETLKDVFQDLIQSVNPVQIVKSSIHKLSQDQQVKIDLAKIGVTFGVNLLLGTVFSRKRNVKVFLAALAIEKVAIPFIKENWHYVEALSNRIAGSSDAATAQHEEEANGESAET
ncbi:MAG: hypothetical protein GC205_00525 [Bacteroidetes bacterium]|nr:hypothetical protein [Bacteroidota bacterium]